MSRSSDRSPVPYLAIACVGFLGSSPARGEEASLIASQDTILVTGVRDGETSSTKATATILDTPQTITVVDAETIEQQNLLTLRDVLSTIPGITFGAGEGGGGYGDSINLRGYSASNDITVDGVRDSAQFSRTDPFNLEAVEVYNGANSVNSGAGAVGGTINLVQKRARNGNFADLEGGIGTDNYYRATIDANRQLGPGTALRLNGMVHENDIPGLEVVRYQRWGIAPSLTVGLQSPVTASLGYVHQEDDNIPVYGVPYFPALGGLVPGGRYSGYYGYRNLDKQEITLDQATARLEAALGEGLTLTNLTRWQHVSQTTIVDPPQGTYCLSDGTTQTGAQCSAGQVPGWYYPSGPRGTTRMSDNRTLANQTDLRAIFETGPVRHTMVIGLAATRDDYELTQGNVQRYADGSRPDLPPILISDPDTLYDGPINFIPSSKQYGQLDNLAAYIFDTMALTPKLELNLGGRIERSDGHFRSDSIAVPADGGGITDSTLGRSNEDLISYRAGLVFKPTPRTSVYASFANSETPSQSTVRLGCVGRQGNFCDAAPEGAVSYELGAKAMVGNLLLTGALFRNERTNYRVSSNDPAVPDPQVLDGRARVNGVALGASGTIANGWSVFANYTYLDSEVLQSVSDYCLANPGVGDCPAQDIQAGRPLESTPKHSGSLFTTYTLPFGLQVGYGVSYQGSYAVVNDADSLLRADDYWLHRAFLAYELGRGVAVQLNVQNLFDTKYFTGIRNSTSGWAVPGEGRSARLTIKYRL